MSRTAWLPLLGALLATTACSRQTSQGSSESSESSDPPAQPGALAPNLHVAGTTVLATWLEQVGASGAHRLLFARLDPTGWSNPTTITESEQIVASWADVPSIAVAGDGALVASWAEAAGSSPYAYLAMVARSADGGATWTPLGPLHDDRSETEHGFVSLVAEGARVRAFWLDGRAGAQPGNGTALRTALVGAAIEGEEVVDPRVCDCCGTAAAATSTGPVVAYRDRSDEEIRDIWVAGKETTWRPRGAVHDDAWTIAGCPVNGPALASRDAQVVVAWYTYAGSVHRVRVAFSRDGGTSFGAPVEVDGPHGRSAPLGRVAVALGPGGDAFVSWMASEREDAAVMVRRVASTGDLGPPVQVTAMPSGRQAGFARMVSAGDDLVVIWTEPGEGSRLRAVRMPMAAVPAIGAAPTAPVASAPAPASRAQVGARAPSLVAVDLAGAAVSLDALRGRVVLLNVWATWCEPCRQELPELAALNAGETARGLDVIAVNVDRDRGGDEIAAFLGKRKVSLPVWLDPADHTSTALGIGTLPATILVGRDGVIRWRRDGAIRADDRELRDALEGALREPAPGSTRNAP